MGASQFTNVGRGTSAREAFNSLVEDARYDYGHAGYTGTIAEKSTYKMASSQIFADKASAYEFVNECMEDDNHFSSDKWGPAAYVSFKKGEEICYLFFGWASS